MIFEEKEPRLLTALLLPLLALALAYPLWHLAERDLFWNEGDYAVIAGEFDSFPPVVTAHGQIMTDEYPLYPLLAHWLSHCGLGMEFSLRFLSLLSFGGLALIIWITCWRAAGLQAAAASASIMLSTILVAEKSIEGYPQMLSVLLIFSGWLLWFNLGQGRGLWDLAWVFAGLFGGLAFYNGGWSTLIYFLVPLMFQRRPLTIWSKINRWGFDAGALIVLAFILFWGLPWWFEGMASPQKVLQPDPLGDSLMEYLEDVCLFPFEVLMRFLPWTLILWAPFCAALIPLDKNPLFSKFLRILTYVLFVLVWLNPDTRGRDILYLAPLLATLGGLNYWIVARRYGYRLLGLFRLTAWLMIAAAGGCIAYLVLPEETIDFIPFITRDLSFKEDPAYLLRSVCELGGSVLLALTALLLCRREKPVWALCLTLFCSAMLIYWAVVNPYKASDHSRKRIGLELREALAVQQTPPGTIVYKDAALAGLYSETYYMGYPVRALNSLSDLPESGSVVYLISATPPTTVNRNWTKLLDTLYRERRLYLWKGVLREDIADDYYDEYDRY